MLQSVEHGQCFLMTCCQRHRVFEIAQPFQSEIKTTSKLFKITKKGNENNVCLYLFKGWVY